MENNKICPKCGAANNDDFKFCKNCGAQTKSNNVVDNEQQNIQQDINTHTIENTQINNNDSNDTKLGIISLVLYFGGTSIFSCITYLLPASFRNYFSSISGLFPLLGIIVMIVGRIKYPNSKLLKIVMWIIIASIILSMIAVILFIMWCVVTCENMDTSGCG